MMPPTKSHQTPGPAPVKASVPGVAEAAVAGLLAEPAELAWLTLAPLDWEAVVPPLPLLGVGAGTNLIGTVT